MHETLSAFWHLMSQAASWLFLQIHGLIAEIEMVCHQTKIFLLTLQPETMAYGAALCLLFLAVLICLAKSLERPYSSYAGFLFYCVSIVLTALFVKLIIGSPEDLEKIARFNKENLALFSQLTGHLRAW